MDLTILKIDERVYSGKFKSVSVPTEAGVVEILPGHTALLTPLKEGKIVYRIEDGEEKEIEIKKGFLEVNNLEVLIII